MSEGHDPYCLCVDCADARTLAMIDSQTKGAPTEQAKDEAVKSDVYRVAFSVAEKISNKLYDAAQFRLNQPSFELLRDDIAAPFLNLVAQSLRTRDERIAELNLACAEHHKARVDYSSWLQKAVEDLRDALQERDTLRASLEQAKQEAKDWQSYARVKENEVIKLNASKERLLKTIANQRTAAKNRKRDRAIADTKESKPA